MSRKITETERLVLREIDSDRDAAFVLELLNTPKFHKYIGDRGVRDLDGAREFSETRYRKSYTDNGFGLYAVELRDSGKPIGLCGFVKRDELPAPDLGFAFLPEFERKGYGFESASAALRYGRETLGLSSLLAITSLDNDASGKLLEKLGFTFTELIDRGDEKIKLYSIDL